MIYLFFVLILNGCILCNVYDVFKPLYPLPVQHHLVPAPFVNHTCLVGWLILGAVQDANRMLGTMSQSNQGEPEIVRDVFLNTTANSIQTPNYQVVFHHVSFCSQCVCFRGWMVDGSKPLPKIYIYIYVGILGCFCWYVMRNWNL